MKIAKALKSVLDLLPVNGEKLKLSGLLVLLGQLPLLFPGLDLIELARMILENPTKAGIIGALIAVVHKMLKAKFPETVR